MPTEDAPGNWTHPGYDASNTGYGATAAGPKGPSLTRVWQYVAGYGGLSTPPIVVNGTVYIGAGDGDARSDDSEDGGGVYAIDFKTGHGRWLTTLPRATRALVADDRGVYAAGTGGITALDRWGQTRWRVDLHLHLTGAAVADGMLIVAARGRPADRPVLTEPGKTRGGRHRSAVVALNAASGRVRWRVDHPVEFESRPIVGDGIVLTTDAEGTTLALDATNGTRLWSRPGDILAVSGGTTFLQTNAPSGPETPDDPALVALDAVTGDRRWRQPFPGQGCLETVVGAGNIFALCFHAGCSDPRCGTLVAYHATTGAVRWQRDLVVNHIYPTALVGAGGMLYSSTYGAPSPPRVNAWDVTTGGRRWRTTPGSPLGSGVALAGGRLLTGQESYE